jgi:hypothetical protein
MSKLKNALYLMLGILIAPAFSFQQKIVREETPSLVDIDESTRATVGTNPSDYYWVTSPGYAVLVQESNEFLPQVLATANLSELLNLSTERLALPMPFQESVYHDAAGYEMRYHYQPDPEMFLAAVVLVNLGQGVTHVDLTYYDQFGHLLGTDTQTDLSPLCPRYVILPAQARETPYVQASSGFDPISAVGFICNAAPETTLLVNGPNLNGLATCSPLPPQIRAWWPLDEVAGPTAQDIIGGNDGTYQNSPQPVSGYVNGALSFPNTTDYVVVPDAPSLNFGTGDLAIEFWINSLDNPLVSTVLDKRESPFQGYSLYLYNGSLGFQLASGGNYYNYNSNAFVADGAWHHAVISVDRDNPAGLVFYLDGVPHQSFNPTNISGNLTNGASLRIAGHSFGGVRFNGTLDELTFYASALSQDIIAYLYQAGPNGKCR